MSSLGLEQLGDDGREEAVLERVDALLERLARLDRERFLAKDRARVEALVDEVDRDAGRLDAGRQGVLDRVGARELAAAGTGGR